MSTQTPLNLTMTFDATSEFVSVIRLTISGVASRMSFSVEDIEDIKIAISEACTNAIQHAYKDTENGKVTVVINIYPSKLEVIISDNGSGFDTAILGTEQQRKKSEEIMNLGLGLTFVESLMDKAEFTSIKGKGTTIRMVKELSPS